MKKGIKRYKLQPGDLCKYDYPGDTSLFLIIRITKTAVVYYEVDAYGVHMETMTHDIFSTIYESASMHIGSII